MNEETGLTVRPTRVAGVFGGTGFRVRYDNGDEAEYTVIVFDCEMLVGHLMPLDGEALELKYFACEDAPELALAYPRDLLDQPVDAPTPPTRF